MSNSFKEETYSDALLELFGNMGWDPIDGQKTDHDYYSPLYDAELESSIRRINRGIAEDAIIEALRKLRDFERASLEQQNETFMGYLQNGVSVDYRENGEKRSELVRLVDYENLDNNSFVAAKEWTFVEKSERRPDLILFLNGLPVVLMELKSLSREDTDSSAAYRQIRNYLKSEIPSMFIYNAICVISDMTQSKAGTITSDEDRYMEWKTKNGKYEDTDVAQFDTFFEGMFQRDRLLDILKNFICFSNDGEQKTKILAAYHQYWAVKKAIEATKNASAEGGDGKGGVVWHSQGSGKSFSMVFYTHLLNEELKSPTVVVLTDRNDLDNQLLGEFSKCKDFLRQTPVQAQSQEKLKELLSETKVNGIFFTTMQKFTESEKPLSTRRNIIVIADEAHRGQYGLSEKFKLKTNKDGETELKRMIGMARRVRNALPNATYLGFTGTPISKEDRCTCEVFGNYIDIYDMTQAVKDGVARPIYYDSRVVNIKLDEDVLNKIDAEYAEIGENADPGTIEKSKRLLGQMDAILGNENTINSLVDDILNHYENHREHLLTGKAMIVAYSREIAMKIYRRIMELRPGWTEKVAVVMTSSNNDPEDWREVIGNKYRKEELATKFKDADSPLKIAIVVDMWLTGFDIPSLATMYLYKRMEGHNLMQAIARVNRVFGKDKKEGLVVDYVGLATALKQAMKDYSPRDRKGLEDRNVSKGVYPKFLEELSICRDLLHGFDYSKLLKGATSLEQTQILRGAINFLLSPEKEKEKEDFRKNSLLLQHALSLCSPIVPAEQRCEAEFFEVIRIQLQRVANIGTGKKISLPQMNRRISELLKQSVKSEGVTNLFSELDEGFSLFDPKFLEELSKMKERNLLIELLRKLLAGKVRVYRGTNIVKSRKFSELLQQKMNEYRNGTISNEDVIKELIKLAKQIAEANKEGEKMNLTPEEEAFYDAITKPQGIKDLYKNEVLVEMTKELTDALRRNKTIDWQKRESARAKMILMVRKLLKRYKYPPEDQEEAIDTVIEQCELWADNQDFQATQYSFAPNQIFFDDNRKAEAAEDSEPYGHDDSDKKE